MMKQRMIEKLGKGLNYVGKGSNLKTMTDFSHLSKDDCAKFRREKVKRIVKNRTNIYRAKGKA